MPATIFDSDVFRNVFTTEAMRTVFSDESRVQKYLVELYLKVSFPLTNLIVVLIGTALAIRVRRGGLAISFGLAVFISFVYYAIIRTGQALGHSGTLPPFLAAWLGNIVFGVLGLELLRRARRGL